MSYLPNDNLNKEGLDKGSSKYGTPKKVEVKEVEKEKAREFRNASPNNNPTCDTPGCKRDTVKWCNKCGGASCDKHLYEKHNAKENALTIDQMAMKLYGKKYSQLPDDGPEQDHCVHEYEKAGGKMPFDNADSDFCRPCAVAGYDVELDPKGYCERCKKKTGEASGKRNASDPAIYEQLKQVKAEIEKLEKSGEDKSRLEKLKTTAAGLAKTLKESDEKKNEDSANLGFQSTEKTTTFDRNKDPLRDGTKLGNEKYGAKKNAESEPLKKPQISDPGGKQTTTENSESEPLKKPQISEDGGKKSTTENHEGEPTPLRVHDELGEAKDPVGNGSDVAVSGDVLEQGTKEEAEEIARHAEGIEHEVEELLENGVTCMKCAKELTGEEMEKALSTKNPYCGNCMSNHGGEPIPFGSGAAPENALKNTPDGTFTEPEKLEYENGVARGKKIYGVHKNSLYTVLPQYESAPTKKMVNDNTFRDGIEQGKKRYGVVRNAPDLNPKFEMGMCQCGHDGQTEHDDDTSQAGPAHPCLVSDCECLAFKKK